MYLLIVTYTKSIDEVSKHIETHAEWVKKYFAEGAFIAAGPKKDKNGGVIFAKNIDREILDKILAEDSYIKSDVASYTVVDFDCKVVKQGLEQLQTA